jgi:DNA-binding transcriptional regulator YiaG
MAQHAFADRFRPFAMVGGALSGSSMQTDNPGRLNVTDLLGQVLILVYLPSSLIVSPDPPSGCALANLSATLHSLGGYLPFSSAGPWSVARLSGAMAASSRQRVVRREHSAQELIRYIQEVYGLHTTDLAELLGVSRQSVHAWKRGGSVPNTASAKKLFTLKDAADEWHKSYGAGTPGWLLHSPIHGKTLQQWLMLVASGDISISEVISKVTSASSDTSISAAGHDHLASSREPTAFEDFVDSLDLSRSGMRRGKPRDS